MRFDPNDYVDVAERITRFWSEYPDGAIRTELASPASAFTEVVFRAEVYKDRTRGAPDAVGYAAEKPGNGANQTSWHENCETSAIGRALANMGYATSQKDRPSRQEMQKVERAQQAAPAPAQRARTVDAVVGKPIQDLAERSGSPGVHPMVQQAIENSTANWIAAMEGAANMAELSKVANEALAANAMTEPVRAIFNKRRDTFQERALA